MHIYSVEIFTTNKRDKRVRKDENTTCHAGSDGPTFVFGKRGVDDNQRGASHRTAPEGMDVHKTEATFDVVCAPGVDTPSLS